MICLHNTMQPKIISEIAERSTWHYHSLRNCTTVIQYVSFFHGLFPFDEQWSFPHSAEHSSPFCCHTHLSLIQSILMTESVRNNLPEEIHQTKKRQPRHLIHWIYHNGTINGNCQIKETLEKSLSLSDHLGIPYQGMMVEKTVSSYDIVSFLKARRSRLESFESRFYDQSLAS